LRTVAAVVGGAGAALNALYYFSAIVGWVAIVLLSGLWPTTLVDLAFVGPLAAAVLLSGVGLVGAWRTWRGAARRGALLMVLAALGIAIVLGVVQPAAVSAAGAYGVPERLRADTGSPPGSYFRAALGPVVPLLAGAALAFLAARRSARP
jgi:hypothetical protein